MTSSVAERSDASLAMMANAAKQRALMGGTKAMRAAGEAYLPKFKVEEQEDYEARKNSSWLFNGYRKTVRDMAGRVFDKPVELTDAPVRLDEWMANADLAGRDLSQFAREVFLDGMQAGISFIMVEAPRRQGGETQAQAQAQNLRPYLVHLRVEDILGWKIATVNNATVLSMLRIHEVVEVDNPDDEFAEDSVEQIRVLNRLDRGVGVRIYRKNAQSEWSIWDDYETDAEEITVAPFYANRTGFFTGEPLLEDLADVNIAHWQSQSDQRVILHFARVPVLFGSGMSDDDPIALSASKAVMSANPDAKLTWVEHSGAAIGAGRQDLKDLEFQMEALGLQLLVSSAETATGEVRQASKETSQLAAIADNLKDALEQVMGWVSFYGNLGEQSVSVVVNKDFGVSLMSAQEVTALLSAVNTGNLSRATFIDEMKRRGFVRDDLSTEDELDAIDSEGPDLGAFDGGE